VVPQLLLANFHRVMPRKYMWSLPPAAPISRPRSKSRRHSDAFAKLLLGDIDEASNTFILAKLSLNFVSLVDTGVGSMSASGLWDFQLYMGDS
jgi:hypothetical protein